MKSVISMGVFSMWNITDRNVRFVRTKLIVADAKKKVDKMSYKLISANDISYNSDGYVTKDNIDKMPYIYADLPNGMDGKGYDTFEWDAPDINFGNIDKIKSNEELYQEFCKRIWNESEDILGSDYVEIKMAKCILWKLLIKKQKARDKE